MDTSTRSEENSNASSRQGLVAAATIACEQRLDQFIGVKRLADHLDGYKRRAAEAVRTGQLTYELPTYGNGLTPETRALELFSYMNQDQSDSVGKLFTVLLCRDGLIAWERLRRNSFVLLHREVFKQHAQPSDKFCKAVLTSLSEALGQSVAQREKWIADLRDVQMRLARIDGSMHMLDTATAFVVRD